MPLSITGFDVNGRIDPKGSNVVIPRESAGIGDLVYKASATDIITIGRGTASATTITKNNKSYQLYACIYGFVNDLAMIGAPVEVSKAFANSGVSIPSGVPAYGWGTVLMRNGIKCTYAQMNTAQQMASDSYRGTAGTNVHPISAYDGGVMTKATFEGNTAEALQARAIYKTWEDYLRQTLRVNGAPGTPFGAVTTGVKVHEFGRWMTDKIKSADYPAGNYCHTYRGAFDTADGNWWLPSMFELGEMMIDDHLNKINENPSGIYPSISAGSHRWSCVLDSSDNAWYYNHYGMSSYTGFTNSLAVRPVSLLKL